MATLDAAWAAAREVETGSLDGFTTHAVPDIRIALWAATLSAQKDLTTNGQLTAPLRPYVTRNEPLPADVGQVWAILKTGAAFCSEEDARHVAWIDWAFHNRLFEPFREMPTDYAGWVTWRKGMYKLCNGHGFSWKTLSFTALLMWPTSCQLVPVDRHVVARLGEPDALREKLGAWCHYNRLEQVVVEEWIAAGRPYTIGIWHWFTWSAWRQATGDETVGDLCESHMLLSPYAY